MQPTQPPDAPAADLDPFRYGWRYVPTKLPDGTVELEQVPLTLEDLLHPEPEDVKPVRTRHEMDCAYLAGVTLLGVVLSMVLGLWWVQYPCALALLIWLIPETLEAFEAARGGHHD